MRENGVFDQPTLARRLRKAREDRGLTQQDAADALGISRTAVTQIEGGSRSVSTLELTRFAELLRRPVGDLLAENGAAPDDDVLVMLYRGNEGLAGEGPRAGVDRCILLFRAGAALAKLLGREASPAGLPEYALRPPRGVGEAIEQGAASAERERRRLGLGDAPIGDVADVVGSQGLWVARAGLGDAVSGLFLRDPSFGMAVIVNAAHARGRRRFSYAHEYAHALLDRGQGGREASVTRVGNAADLAEKRANAFAAAFLMPEGGVADLLRALDKGRASRHEHAVFDVATGHGTAGEVRPPPRSQRITFQDAAFLARHFGASYPAAVYRLKSLGRISSAECGELLGHEDDGRRLLKALRRHWDLEKEPDTDGDMQPGPGDELTSQVAWLAIEAYRREEISRGRLLELAGPLEMPGRELLDLAEAARAE